MYNLVGLAHSVRSSFPHTQVTVNQTIWKKVKRQERNKIYILLLQKFLNEREQERIDSVKTTTNTNNPETNSRSKR